MGYDHLVVAAGLQINWGKIKGLPETIGACVRLIMVTVGRVVGGSCFECVVRVYPSQ